GTGGIGQKEGVAGGGGSHHHEALASLTNDPREGLKHGNLFGTGGTQIFVQQGATLGGQHLGTVTFSLGMGIDAADLQAGQCPCQCLSQMGSGI
ncbi:hypothetical protein, partial [Aliarcobacter cryaerophilus]|uniref:hypothetical protein n=1 Tax=Aliarcobacter cryaerophilus TaxID=28198 RepID=UPI003F66ABE5